MTSITDFREAMSCRKYVILALPLSPSVLPDDQRKLGKGIAL
jgi:hypothetical protein